MDRYLTTWLSIVLLSGLFAMSVQPAQAFTPPSLTDLNSGQVDGVFKDFGSSFVFRPLEPASGYGRIYGFSFGVIGTLSSSADIRNNISGTSGLSYVPNAQIFLGMQFPKGFAAELGFLPTVTVGGFKIHSVGGDVKWTLNDFSDKTLLPFELAFRAMYTASGLTYGETVSGVNDTISYSASSYGLNVSASEKILFMEPYIGLGYVHTSNTLSNTGSVTLYDQSVSATDSFSDGIGGVWLYAGVQFRLLFLALTAEYDDIYGSGSGSAKFSFKF